MRKFPSQWYISSRWSQMWVVRLQVDFLLWDDNLHYTENMNFAKDKKNIHIQSSPRIWRQQCIFLTYFTNNKREWNDISIKNINETCINEISSRDFIIVQTRHFYFSRIMTTRLSDFIKVNWTQNFDELYAPTSGLLKCKR